MNIKIKLGVLCIVILLFVFGLSVGISKDPILAGMSNFDGITITPAESGDGLKVGSTGTSVTKMITGTCNLSGYAGNDTIAADAIATTSCAVTGVLTSGDKVFVSLPATANSVVVQAAVASSTAGNITVVLLNATSSANQVTRVGSSTQYWIVR
jgi:hypothetical protein